MGDETTTPGRSEAQDPGPATADDAEAGLRVLDAQQARIAALRAAVLSGRVPDPEGFDYEAFFADHHEKGRSPP